MLKKPVFFFFYEFKATDVFISAEALKCPVCLVFFVNRFLFIFFFWKRNVGVEWKMVYLVKSSR